VAKSLKRNTNDIHAQKLVDRGLIQAKKVLSTIGKPFYYILSSVVIAILFILYITGHIVRVLITTFFKGIIKLILIIPLSIKYLIFLFKNKKIKTGQRISEKVLAFKTFLKRLRYKRQLSLLKLPKIPTLKKVGLPQFTPRKSLRFALIGILILIPALFIFIIFVALPSPNELVTRDQKVSTKIYDRNGILLFNIYKDKNRSLVELEDIPLHVRYATIAAEDAEFYSHPGFSVKGIVRAVVKNVSEGKISGGSTITQQLVKNALLTPEKTLTRKAKEIVLAIRVEIQFTKDEILEMYLNEVPYGGTAYGIQEASRLYFDKDVNKLTLGEAALLVGLPKSPTKFSPFGTNPDLTKSRQIDVLHLMRINGYISEEQEEKALNENIHFAANEIDIKAPHFVMYTKEILENQFGKEVVETGGLKVITTLDYKIQALAEKVVYEELESLKGLNVTNGGVIVLDPKTGEILAMVGSKNYFDRENDGNVNVTLALRQPGSSIKVVNYAYALSSMYTPASILSDTPISYTAQGQPTYTPRNYDGEFRGNLTLRNAFAESRNVPAVKILASYGVNNMIEQGKKMGITTWEDKNRFGLSLTLGGGEVKLIELAQVYATIANSGKKAKTKSILFATNSRGKVLVDNTCETEIEEEKEEKIELAGIEVGAEKEISRIGKMEKEELCKAEEVVDPRVAYLITDILKDNDARSPAFGSHSQLVIPGHTEVAVKTGTSNNLRDNLTIGYNQDYLVAVWVGNNDNTPMSRVASGITGASPIFNKVMTAILFEKENHDWAVPSGLVKAPICTLTGTLTCDGCPTKIEWFLEENVPTQHCSPEHVKGLKEIKPEPQILESAASTERR